VKEQRNNSPAVTGPNTNILTIQIPSTEVILLILHFSVTGTFISVSIVSQNWCIKFCCVHKVMTGTSLNIFQGHVK
jgi:hypothetical protein